MSEGGTSAGNVLADIYPGERLQEMEEGEADDEVAWLASWTATRDGSPRLLSYGGDEQEKGGREGGAEGRDLLCEHAHGELRA